MDERRSFLIANFYDLLQFAARANEQNYHRHYINDINTKNINYIDR